MSTKIARADQTITEFRMPFSGSVRALTGSLVPLDTILTSGSPHAATWAVMPPAIIRADPKAIEAQRQIGRVQSLRRLCPQDPAEKQICVDSIASSVALIGSFLASPFLPIPIASSGSDYGTTLFFEGEDFYGDVEVKGKTVEYYIRSNRDNNQKEVYDSEEMEDARVPPRLLAYLFSHYAR